MRYSIGDAIRFKIGKSEQWGEVKFIEQSRGEHILYVNSFSGWAYKINEERIVSGYRLKNKSFDQVKGGPYRGENGEFSPHKI